MIGQTVSHYRILSKLGAGGMGVVYQAEDTRLKRIVALKFLPPELTRDESAKTRFIHEARAASALQHHNICTIHDIDETPDGQLFIAMDCYAGETLKEKIARGPLSAEEAVDIASQVAAGLSKAHEAGMVHRDIKPANIIVTKDGVVKLLDFGLAKLAGMTKVTKTGMTVGTVAYMSPEQARGEEADARSDIWSLGAVLYEMLTGRVPFPGDHEAAVLYGVMNSEPKPLAEVNQGVPHELQAIVDRALMKDPNERYANVLELRDELDAANAGIGARRIQPFGGTSRSSGVRSANLTKRIVAGATMVAVLVVLGLVIGPRLRRAAPVEGAHALAVMDFRDLATPDDPLTSAGITELVNIGIIQTDLVRVISSDRLHDLRRRLFGSPRGAIEESQTIEIAREAGATMFLIGTVGISGGGRYATWHLVDVASGDDVKAGRVTGNELAQLADRMVAEAVPAIARRCGVTERGMSVAVESITTESPRAYQHYMAGRLAADEYARERAVAEFERAVAQDSTFALAYLWLGKMYWGGMGYQQPQRAGAFTEKAWAMRSRLGIQDQLRLQSLRYDVNNQTGSAIAVLREMLVRWPDDRETIRDLQDRLYFRWYFADAVEVGERGHQLYPDDIRLGGPIYLAGLVNLGRIDEALEETRAYVKRHPAEPNAWDELGWRYLACGLPDSAEAAFGKAAALEPNWIPENVASCAYHRGDLKGAIADLEQLLDKGAFSPEERRLLATGTVRSMNLAALCVEAGRYQRAADACGPHLGFPSADIGRHLLVMNRAQDVMDLARRWADADTTRWCHFLTLRLRGRASVLLGDTLGARAVARQLLDSEFESGGRARFEAKMIQAQVALAGRDTKAALDALAAMKAQGPVFGGYIDIDYRTTLAAAFRMAGRLDDAAAVHGEMLRIYGGHALSHYELGQIYEEMKRPADAKKEYAKFLEMWSDAEEGLPQLLDARKRVAAL